MRELNWKPEQSVELTVLGDTHAGAHSTPARLLELSGKRLRLAAASPVAPGAAVRLEWDGQLLLGEVLDTTPSGVWIEIHHMLLDAAGLSWQKQGWQR
jgi:hypothetical protein